ncbi:hypothetical protein GQ457_03G028050 [Hibiscus cannabinus]
MSNLSACLKTFSVGECNIGGTIPREIGGLKDVYFLQLNSNNLIGSVPATIARLEKLQGLILGGNKLQGPILHHLCGLKSLYDLSLDVNELDEPLPACLSDLTSLRDLSLSYNKFHSPIPSSFWSLEDILEVDLCGGSFLNFTDQPFLNNYALCGSPRFRVSPCVHQHHKKTLIHALRYVLPIFASNIIVAALIIVCIQSKKKKKKKKSTKSAIVEDPIPLKEWKRISYDQLSKGTDGFSEANILGSGSFGTVYTGTLSDGQQVAVKVFDLQIEGAFKSFDVECEVMSKIIHRNLVKVITCCSNTDFKALVLEFMPNGSLEKWLYSANHSLDILQRIT